MGSTSTSDLEGNEAGNKVLSAGYSSDSNETSHKNVEKNPISSLSSVASKVGTSSHE
jgi:hypothetical protein